VFERGQRIIDIAIFGVEMRSVNLREILFSHFTDDPSETRFFEFGEIVRAESRPHPGDFRRVGFDQRQPFDKSFNRLFLAIGGGERISQTIMRQRKIRVQINGSLQLND